MMRLLICGVLIVLAVGMIFFAGMLYASPDGARPSPTPPRVAQGRPLSYWLSRVNFTEQPGDRVDLGVLVDNEAGWPREERLARWIVAEWYRTLDDPTPGLVKSAEPVLTLLIYETLNNNGGLAKR